jgi:hypothetical protein
MKMTHRMGLGFLIVGVVFTQEPSVFATITALLGFAIFSYPTKERDDEEG